MNTAYQLSDFDYHLPPSAIAQEPAEPRDASRLLVSHPDRILDRYFHELPDLLAPGDLLVLNDTRVLPARLIGRKPTGGRLEVFLLRPLARPGVWLALTRGLKPGVPVTLAPGLTAERIGQDEEGQQVLLTAADHDLPAAIQRHGVMPLPPYITHTDPERDRTRYQTVYARQPGAVAAPTAGLHFTPELLGRLASREIRTTTVTLHVGLATFQPVRHEDLARHVMHREWCCLTLATAQVLNQTRQQGGRVIAVGTTAARVLETATREPGRTEPFAGETDLFILPGYRFRGLTGLITNFHLPKSTLLMLVAGLIGKDRLDRDYRHAMAQGYRFYSYGDASLLLP